MMTAWLVKYALSLDDSLCANYRSDLPLIAIIYLDHLSSKFSLSYCGADVAVADKVECFLCFWFSFS